MFIQCGVKLHLLEITYTVGVLQRGLKKPLLFCLVGISFLKTKGR